MVSSAIVTLAINHYPGEGGGLGDLRPRARMKAPGRNRPRGWLRSEPLVLGVTFGHHVGQQIKDFLELQMVDRVLGHHGDA